MEPKENLHEMISKAKVKSEVFEQKEKDKKIKPEQNESDALIPVIADDDI